MKHRIRYRKLNRTTSHRMAMIRNLTRDLVLNEKIETTVPKAKEVRSYVEKLITKAKKRTSTSYIILMSKLVQKDVCQKLYETIAPKYIDRNGGYTRIIRTRNRKGDNAEMALIEFV